MTPPDSRREAYFPLAIQLNARAWKEYDLTLDLLDNPGSPLYPLRQLSARMQRKKPQTPVSAAQLNLLAQLNEVFRHIIGRYLERHRYSFTVDGALIDDRRIDLSDLSSTMAEFVRLYPPFEVLRGASPEEFLKEAENRKDIAIELFLLAVQAENPAASDFSDLFDDTELNQRCGYRDLLSRLDIVPETEGLLGGSLLFLLRGPMQASPHSLSGQLDYIRRYWPDLLPPELLSRILTGFAVLAEEQAVRGFGGGPAPIPRFASAGEEPERFSPDTDWMPNVVLIAKTIYVWLDQLSRRYSRTIDRIDQIPDEELDRLARWGFNSLWLIGIWERSAASEKIKRTMGNPEAVASAYSLYDYVVAHDLGDESALENLEERCRQRGISLACDVVPNHTGIYSRWTREHPDWYVQVNHPPYPSYRFSRQNLSYSDDIELYIEDGYWEHSDAAVVFKHVDRRDGRVRYIYHGNDGTHLPWNDTAQLNFLLPQVREAMIRTILKVARRFKVIRFDAAMTLAKKHYQRLWFPQPDGGAGVPSRAEHAMDAESFERAFPVEFWREVVDRVAAEAPDTLLLAEAFWLMEGYFVRTLGMHRVYNSAFMNMLKVEENQKYRSVIKNILEFNPEILKRFVNFMNNPDEATAVAQFGKGDKYFGVAVMLVTMPGLPMFGHGQVEGFEEKYGMEYRRAYYDETPDEAFIRHHEAQIFPLMHRRHLFSGSRDFVLYDFWSDGLVNENVFAYSNRFGDERTLVVYNNLHADTGGWIRNSVPKMTEQGGGRQLTHSHLGEALGIDPTEETYYRFRDFRTGLEYLRRGRELVEQGVYLQLGPYEYHVFLDFQEIRDTDGSWHQLWNRLDGSPAEALEREARKIRYAPLREAFAELQTPLLRKRLTALVAGEEPEADKDISSLLTRLYGDFLSALARYTGNPPVDQRQAGVPAKTLATVSWLSALKGGKELERAALKRFREGLPRPAGKGKTREEDGFRRIFLPWLTLHRIGDLSEDPGSEFRAGEWVLHYLLTDPLLHHPGQPIEKEAEADLLLVEILIRRQNLLLPRTSFSPAFTELLEDTQVSRYLGRHWHRETEWINRERFETLLRWLFFITAVRSATALDHRQAPLLEHLTELDGNLEKLLQAAEKAGYRLDRLTEFL